MENHLPVYQKIARFVKELRDAEECLDRKKTAALKAKLAFAVSYYMPDDRSDLKSVQISVSESQPEKLVFYCTLEHRDEDGALLNTTPHRVTITPSLTGTIRTRVKGPGNCGDAEYIDSRFFSALLMPFNIEITDELLN